MRSRAFVVTSLIALTLISVPASAATLSDDGLLVFPFHAAIGQTDTPATPIATLPALPSFPDPDPAIAIGDWFGCNPPFGGVCVTDPSVPIPPGRLVPRTVDGIDDWRPLVEAFFEPSQVNRALAVIGCESGGNPSAKNPHSTASGLFQHLGSLWADRSVQAGQSGADIFDPVANVAVAAWLVNEGGGWSHWNPSRHCWR